MIFNPTFTTVPLTSSSTGPTPKKRGRKKKITTPPGKAVQPEDFIDGPPRNKNDVVAPEVEKRVRKRKVKPVPSVQLSDGNGAHISNELELPQLELASPLIMGDISENDFIIVWYTFDSKRGKKNVTEECCFVGQVETIFTNRVQVKFLRPYTGNCTNFHYPQISDIDYIKFDNIVKVLPTPTAVRDVFYFNEAPL